MDERDWRDIPGYDGAYQVSRMGDVRSWRWRGQRAKAPHLLRQFTRKPRGNSRRSGRRYVKLTAPDGTAREVAVLNIIVDTWLGGRPPGMVAYHRNGDLTDNCLHNIAFTTRKALGEKTGGNAARRPVVKIAPDGEVVEAYPSAREAARKNHMSYQTVLDRCNGKVKKPFALDGHDYRFEV